MVTDLDLIRVAVVVALGISLAYFLFLGAPKRWYDRLSERFLYGVPWGTVVTVVGVVAFYLFAQSGLSHWNAPVVMAFRSWSYLYPEGLLAAGFAHASPNHLISNMVGTVVLAPIVEYAWGHYPPPRTDGGSAYEYPPPGAVEAEPVEPGGDGWYNRPWVRALVVFPAAVVVVSIVTSVLALGWSLGFSGTVFAFGGFAVVFFPVAAILAMVAFSGTGVIVSVLRTPVLRATTDTGSPGPPSWWGVNVQAHLLGFLLGVLIGLALLSYRNEKRQPVRVFLAVLAFALTRQLWSLAVSGGDGVFLQQRGIGTVFVLVLTMLITAAVAASEKPFPALLADVSLIPERERLANLWLTAVGLVAAGLLFQLVTAGIDPIGSALVVVAFVVLVLPALPVVLPDRIVTTPVSRRQVLVFGIVAVALIVALPSFFTNAPAIDEDPLRGAEAVSVGDYQITYAEDVPHGRISTNESGVIVVSERRGIWSTVTGKGELARQGESTVVVGGFGWRETVEANRSGWDLAGGAATYVVDIEGEERKQVFLSDGATAQPRIKNYTLSIRPDGEQFVLQAMRNGTTVGTVPVPDRNETAELGELRLSTEPDGGSLSVFAESNGTRVQIATRE